MMTLLRDFARVDKKGRLNLGQQLTGKAYRVEQEENGNRIILTAVTQVPESEAWLYGNPEAMALVRQGLSDSASGKVRYVGSYSGYADAEID